MERTKEELEYSRRVARANSQANKSDDPLAVPIKIRRAMRRQRLAREALLKPIRKKAVFDLGRRSSAPTAKKATFDRKQSQIKTAIGVYFADYPTTKNRITAESLTKQLSAFSYRYFPSGVPYPSTSKLLREIRIVLAKVRPKRQRPV